MNVDQLLKNALGKGQAALNEKEAKDLLRAYGIPVVPERIAAGPDEAVQAARDIGFPVVLKGLGASLLHKTEQGLVHLNLSNPQAVEEAASAIVAAAGDALEGLLIQPQISARRELVAGLFMDPQFGPVVMFGIGGIFTEAYSDVSFRLTPLVQQDAEDMLQEIQAQSILDPFRGEAAVNRDQIIATLLGLSRIGAELPQISEIDINPMRVSADGSISAVDALVVMKKRPRLSKPQPAISPGAIGSLFHPKSIAFIGASAQFGKWGHMLMANTISGGFKGSVYLVNPKGGTIAGRKVYASVEQIEDEVDLAVVTIPAANVLDLIPQLQRKAIRNVLLITSGFAETGKAGKQLEAALTNAARKAGILLLGPNTMGICNPHINLYCTGSQVTPRPGSTAVVAQSGNMGIQLLAFADQQGIGIRGFCGSGNEAMMTIEDYLDGFEFDTLTQTVILYVESVKNGRRFFESARRLGRKKPIVLLKGGRSEAGVRAAASHTGAMASDARIFDAVCRQTGIVKVEKPMDLLDLAAAFSSLPLPRGNRVAIMTLGGGWGVVTADLCSDFGLDVPKLSPKIIAGFDKLLPAYWSRSNPIDLVGETHPKIPLTVMEELLKWDRCDGVINLGIIGRRFILKRLGRSVLKADPSYSAEFIDDIYQRLTDFEQKYIDRIVVLMAKYKKPIVGVSLLPAENDQTVYRVENQAFKGVFYPTPERAVKAFAKMYEYHRFLMRERAEY